MCLITPYNKPVKAEYDITVWKLFRIDEPSKFRSIYQDFIYTPEQLYTTELKRTWSSSVFDNHADRSLMLFAAEHGIGSWDIRQEQLGIIVIGEGFHSALTPDRFEVLVSDNLPFIDYKVARCTIPKGSTLYTDLSELVVSDQIIIHNDYI